MDKLLGLILFTAVILSTPAYAATITVTTTADENNTDGDCSLREAVRSANANSAVDACTAGSGTDTIILGAGTYTLNGAGITAANENSAATGDLDILGNTVIQGNSPSTTIVHGNGTDRVFHLPSSGVSLTLTGMTVRNGNPGNDGGNGGAGVMVGSGATLIVSDCVFRDNTAASHVSAGGGAIDSQGNFTITDSEFFGNTSQNDGAIRCLATCTGSITDTVIRNNLANGYVGGGLGAAGNLSLLRVQVLDNSNTGGGGAGGLSCLQLNGGTNAISVTDSLFRGNTSNTNAGGIAVFTIPGAFEGSPSVTVTNTTVSGNSARGYGGGIYVSAGTATLSNVTVTGNTSDSDNNDGSNRGGGIARVGGTLNARNTLIADNADTGNAAADCSGTISSQGNNLIRNASGCTINGSTDTITGLDPLLGDLADNGGPTDTHALDPASPAVNAGTLSGCTSPAGAVSADQRGVSRSQGSACDIGAFELSCGFGTVDAVAGEACDDGNNATESCAYGQTSCSVCNASCQSVAGAVSYCGDGVTQAASGETCDDSNTVTEQCNYQAGACTVCNATCQSVAGQVTDCGDGVVQAGEACDDNNTVTESCAYGAGACTVCAGNCTSVAGSVFSCGDGILQSSEEECDEGGNNGSGDCTADCLVAVDDSQEVDTHDGNDSGSDDAQEDTPPANTPSAGAPAAGGCSLILPR